MNASPRKPLDALSLGSVPTEVRARQFGVAWPQATTPRRRIRWLKLSAGAASDARLRIGVVGERHPLDLPLRDVLRLHSAENYVWLVTRTESLWMRGPLCRWQERLPCPPLLRVHRGCLLHTEHVRAIEPSGHGDFRLLMSDGHWQRSGRAYYAVVSALRRALRQRDRDFAQRPPRASPQTTVG